MSTFVPSSLPALALIGPMLAPVAIVALRRVKNSAVFLSLAAAIVTVILAALTAAKVADGQVLTFTVARFWPGITFTLAADALSVPFSLVASGLWIVATFYNRGYLEALNEHARTRYFACFAVAIFGAVGVAFSGNVLTLFFFYEVITVSTYPLVAHHEDDYSIKGARTYLVYLMGASKLFLLPALALTWHLCGSLDFSLGQLATGVFPATADPNLVRLTYALYILGLAKSAIIPLHGWLPAAMVAPAPVSALLHAVAVVKAGVFSVARVMLCLFGTNTLHGLGLAEPTAIAAAVTILVASAIALTKDDLKARLAYSTVSQLSYIVLGVALLAPAAIMGGISQIVIHALAKITLFFVAGAILVGTHIKKISELNGIGRKMPLVFCAGALGIATMIGLPPVGGFAGKWLLLQGATQVSPVWLWVLAGSTLLNAAYFLPILFRGFLLPQTPGVHFDPLPVSMTAALCFTALASVAAGPAIDLIAFWPKLLGGF